MQEEFKAKHVQLRYILLTPQDLEIKPLQENIILISQKKWKDLTAVKRSPLVNDLFNCIGELGVGEFLMEKAKKNRVVGGLEKVGEAWAVLEAVRAEFQPLGRPWPFEAYEFEDGAWYLGCSIRPTSRAEKATKFEKNLSQRAKYRDWPVAWFGYYGPGPKTPEILKRAITIYCGSNDLAKNLGQKDYYKEALPDVGEEDGIDCLYIQGSTKESALCDVDWFCENLRLASKAPLPKPGKR